MVDVSIAFSVSDNECVITSKTTSHVSSLIFVNFEIIERDLAKSNITHRKTQIILNSRTKHSIELLFTDFVSQITIKDA